MADTTSYYYWVDVYTPVSGGASWSIDSYVAHYEYPSESLPVVGVTANKPTTGQYRRIRGPVARTPGMSDPAFSALLQSYKDNIPPTPFSGSSSGASSTSSSSSSTSSSSSSVSSSSSSVSSSSSSSSSTSSSSSSTSSSSSSSTS